MGEVLAPRPGHSKLLSTYHEDFLNFQKKSLQNRFFLLAKKIWVTKSAESSKVFYFFLLPSCYLRILADDSYHTLLLEKSERI